MSERWSRKGGAAELLVGWRAAERDTAAAKTAADIAALALAAAHAAEEAAAETEAAAKASAEAVERASRAAGLARTAANSAAHAARLLTVGAEGDKARANHDVEIAEQAERSARERFHKGRDRDSSGEDS